MLPVPQTLSYMLPALTLALRRAEALAADPATPKRGGFPDVPIQVGTPNTGAPYTGTARGEGQGRTGVLFARSPFVALLSLELAMQLPVADSSCSCQV